MSIITLQFGQCGNQIGQVLFSDLYNNIQNSRFECGKRNPSDYFTEASVKWFNINNKEKWEPRSVLIDTENKVIRNANNNNTTYEFQNIVAKSHGGSANNWACGYSSKSQLLVNEVVDCVRNEMEKCDSVSSILNILSCGGGTGSGVGSRIIEVLREQYPSKTMVNVTILPFNNGEVVTQSYNTLLTLSKIYDISDMMLLYENDVINQMCMKFLSLKNVTFWDINSIIAQQLASILQPIGNISLPQIVTNVAAHSHYKMVQIKSFPHVCKEYLKFEGQCTWTFLINRLKNLLKSTYGKYDSKMSIEISKKIKCLSNFLVSWGNTCPTEEELKLLSDNALYAGWVPIQFKLNHYHQPRTFQDLNKFVSLLTNSNAVCYPLSVILEDFLLTFNSGAYLHHYKKYDVDKSHFVEAFDKVETIFANYNKL